MTIFEILTFPKIATQFQKGLYQKSDAPYPCGKLEHENFEQQLYQNSNNYLDITCYPAIALQTSRIHLRANIIKLPSEEVGYFQ